MDLINRAYKTGYRGDAELLGNRQAID